jgi:hypothetical protein
MSEEVRFCKVCGGAIAHPGVRCGSFCENLPRCGFTFNKEPKKGQHA